METTPSTSPPLSSPSELRNTFLTVICILTFIGSSWGLVKAIRNYAAAETVSAIAGEAIKNAEDKMDQQDTPGILKRLMDSVTEKMSPDNIRKYSIFRMISNILTLLGALLMWNQKRTGFYIYIAGILVLISVPLLMGGLLGFIGGGFTGFIGLIFIVMYGLNLKYMTK